MEAGLLQTTPEKRNFSESGPQERPLSPRRASLEGMPPASKLVITCVACLLVTLGLAAVIDPRLRPCLNGHHEQASDVLSSIQVKSLGDSGSDSTDLNWLPHAHGSDRHRHGIYQTDEKALEAVHGDDAAQAANLARLAKREDTNTTTTTTSTTSPPPSTTTSTKSPPATTTSSNPPPPTTTPTTTPTSTVGPGTSTVTQKTTSPTTTVALSSPVVSTFTSTDSNGQVSIVTSTSYVNVNPTAAGQTSSTQGTAGLQNGGSRPGVMALPIVIGLILEGLVAI